MVGYRNTNSKVPEVIKFHVNVYGARLMRSSFFVVEDPDSQLLGSDV